LINRVFPGVADTFAKDFRFVNVLSSELFPVLDRAIKATSFWYSFSGVKRILGADVTKDESMISII
jgi:hypothetical protein